MSCTCASMEPSSVEDGNARQGAAWRGWAGASMEPSSVEDGNELYRRGRRERRTRFNGAVLS